jgi:hypothetical protein
MFRNLSAIAAVAGTLTLACGGTSNDSPALDQLVLVADTWIGEESARPEYQFTAISQVAVDGDAVFVRQNGIQEIRVFSADGTFLRTIGRSGAGPGEFASLESMGILGDTLWAIDGDLRRITLFSMAGSVLATIPVTGLSPSFGTEGSRYFPYPKVLSADGVVLGFGGWSGRDIASGRTTNQPLLRMSRTGETQDTLGWVPLGNDHLILRGNRVTMYRMQPFTDAPITVYGATAGRVFVIYRDDPVDPVAAAVHVTALTVAGDTAWSLDLPYTPAPLPRSHADSVLDGLKKALVRRIPPDVIERALYVPSHRAPITAALAGEDGTLWLRWGEDTRAGTYTVIGPDGRVRGEVAAAPSIHLRWVSRDLAWGAELDANDVPTLVRYRLALKTHAAQSGFAASNR